MDRFRNFKYFCQALYLIDVHLSRNRLKLGLPLIGTLLVDLLSKSKRNCNEVITFQVISHISSLCLRQPDALLYRLLVFYMELISVSILAEP